MKVIEIDGDAARLAFIDLDGRICTRFASVRAIAPLWTALTPQTLWPDGGNLDLLEIEREERAAAAQRKAARRKARKARRSSKIKRKAA